MTDCFQPCELQYRTTYQTIQEMNLCGVSYLIVTKSALPAAPEYLEILDKELAHVQITVTCLDDAQTAQFEKASPPSQRIRAIQALQAEGYDVAIRLSPIIEEYMDFDKLIWEVRGVCMTCCAPSRGLSRGVGVLISLNIPCGKEATIIFLWKKSSGSWKKSIFRRRQSVKM